jgi:hypothetical protein
MKNEFPERICPICGLIFTPTKPNQKYCHECKQKHPEKIHAYLKKKAAERQIRPYKPIKNIQEVTAELEAYNKKHHTHLKYGQYVYLMENGGLKK